MRQPLSFWEQFLQKVKQRGKSILNFFQSISEKYSNISQNIQLTFLYFFAFIDLFYAILNSIFSLGYFPEILKVFFPFIQAILFSPVFQMWASPEKVFFLSYLVIEIMIVRSTFNFSKLVKYNVLLVFALLMLQGLAISYWDLLFHREIATSAAIWAIDKGPLLHIDKSVAVAFFLNTFIVFSLFYLYFYFCALQGKFATIPKMEWLTDSVAFWLHIRTPTMNIGNGNENEMEENSEGDENDD
uniref:Uncharacterized protein n=1 Tax=Mallomonas splendens TaxID=52552 RepID=A0A3G2R0H5_9STRA|nr:hypothetical protein [Mallomonas splendens]YP_009545457.1 hypothetical protein [Mallomonas splendens]AYO28604.1 hypothetical protein [Mallomonas splendens]AYO28611.1 hypothetical protein [Mallomonas splendens]